jgi:hypothetical protein
VQRTQLRLRAVDVVRCVACSWACSGCGAGGSAANPLVRCGVARCGRCYHSRCLAPAAGAASAAPCDAAGSGGAAAPLGAASAGRTEVPSIAGSKAACSAHACCGCGASGRGIRLLQCIRCPRAWCARRGSDQTCSATYLDLPLPATNDPHRLLYRSAVACCRLGTRPGAELNRHPSDMALFADINCRCKPPDVRLLSKRLVRCGHHQLLGTTRHGNPPAQLQAHHYAPGQNVVLSGSQLQQAQLQRGRALPPPALHSPRQVPGPNSATAAAPQLPPVAPVPAAAAGCRAASGAMACDAESSAAATGQPEPPPTAVVSATARKLLKRSRPDRPETARGLLTNRSQRDVVPFSCSSATQLHKLMKYEWAAERR